MEYLESYLGLKLNSGIILPTIATFSVIILVFGKLYYRIRGKVSRFTQTADHIWRKVCLGVQMKKFSVAVNCWFCNTSTKVPFNSSNSWYCSHCDQYNGFTSDGGYNRLLPEQFNEKLNCGEWCSKTREKLTASNGLCRFCNINHELKIHQLAQFVPMDKENYDEEIQQYSDQLERVYRLCSRCQVVLEKTLNEKHQQFITNQHYSFKGTVEKPIGLSMKRERHSAFIFLTSLLCVGLLVSVLPYHWMSHLLTIYTPPEYLLEMLTHVERYVPKEVQSSVFLILGLILQLFDCFSIRDTTSFVNLLIWTILLTLAQVEVKIEGLVSAVYMLASIVFFVSLLLERRARKPRTIAAVKPVQLQKLEKKLGVINGTEGKTKSAVEELNPFIRTKLSPKSVVSDISPSHSIPPSRAPTTEDFGFGKLNVTSRRMTRSQTKHFEAKHYQSQSSNDLFKPKPVNLSPPKLHYDNTFDYHVQDVPLTRSSSQSSGFVSLSQQKDFEEYRSRSPSVIDNIDSVSQCGGVITSYQGSPFGSPSYPQPFGMPFSHFQPYTIMHFSSPPPIDKFYQYSNMLAYNTSMNSSTTSNLSNAKKVSWFEHLKSTLSSILFIVLIVSNCAVLWKVFGEEYFKFKT